MTQTATSGMDIKVKSPDMSCKLSFSFPSLEPPPPSPPPPAAAKRRRRVTEGSCGVNTSKSCWWAGISPLCSIGTDGAASPIRSSCKRRRDSANNKSNLRKMAIWSCMKFGVAWNIIACTQIITGRVRKDGQGRTKRRGCCLGPA